MKKLDEIYPSWYEEVDIDDINMSRSSCCVLTLVYGDYEDALRVLSIEPSQAYLYGFDMEPLSDPYLYTMLTCKWCYQIRKRMVIDDTEEFYCNVGGWRTDNGV
jgi:hypothetical protein